MNQTKRTKCTEQYGNERSYFSSQRHVIHYILNMKSTLTRHTCATTFTATWVGRLRLRICSSCKWVHTKDFKIEERKVAQEVSAECSQCMLITIRLCMFMHCIKVPALQDFGSLGFYWNAKVELSHSCIRITGTERVGESFSHTILYFSK